MDLRLFAAQVGDKAKQFAKADCIGRAASEIEYLAANLIDVVEHPDPGIDRIVDEQRVANLVAVAINRDRPLMNGLEHKMRDPALVLVAKLPWAVDAAHPENDRSQPEYASVVADVLVCRSLR